MAEIAGLALSTVPIFVGALQQYGTLYKLCRRFRKCKSGTEELIACLDVQKAIFKNETGFLFGSVIGMEQSREMLQDPGHPSWADPVFSSRLDNVLGISKQAVIVAVESARNKMREFEEEIEKLDAGDLNARYGSKEWRKALRSRFKFTFSETKLAHIASSIRRATKDYRVLRAQVQGKLSSIPDSDSVEQLSPELERIQATQKTAARVYEILAKACTLHSKHHAQFSLTPNYASSSMGSEVQFQIAYRHLTQNQVQSRRDVLWFVVESIINKTENAIPLNAPPLAVADTQKLTSQRPLSAIRKSLRDEDSAGKKAKRVRIRSPSPPIVYGPSASTTASHSTPFILPELGVRNDFCTQLRACTNESHQAGTCIGWLENSPEWKHRVFHSLGPTKPTTRGNDDADTLAGLLNSLVSDKQGRRSLSIVQRLRLAKLLSTAMLIFNATP